MSTEPQRPPRWLPELTEFVSIQSVSADQSHTEDVVRAGEWVRDLVRRAGGEADWAPGYERRVIAGEISPSRASKTPTVLIYGHFDVQPPDPLELWHSPPFTATVRDGCLYGRGVVDDKGQLFALLKAAEELAASGDLPVRVRVVCDGEEEIAGQGVSDFLSAEASGADVCVIYDAALTASGRPTFIVGTRGLLYLHVRLRTGESDLHSGLYGGAALNALHALIQSLASVLPVGGRLPAPLREGIEDPGESIALPAASTELAETRARPADATAAAEFHIRTLAEPSVDIHGIAGGSADLLKTVIPAEARANLSIRLVPKQDPEHLAAALEKLLHAAAPAGTEINVAVRGSTPAARVDPQSTAIRVALDAVEAVTGTRPLLTRWGASLPVVSAVALRGIPTVLSGFAPPNSNMHAPNEWMPLSSIETAIDATKAMFRAWAATLT